MTNQERWAARAAELPEDDRKRRECAFWQQLVGRGGWQKVVDAGCGAGFHIRMLTSLGVWVLGFDRSLTALRSAPRFVAAGDLLAPPVLPEAADAVLCLGNTLSLLPDRRSQHQALTAMVGLVRPGGQLLIQGEDVGALTSSGPLLRNRVLSDGRIHLRAFVPLAGRVVMAAGVARPGGDCAGAMTTLIPTNRSTLAPLGRKLGLESLTMPEGPSSSPATWWILWQKPLGGRGARL